MEHREEDPRWLERIAELTVPGLAPAPGLPWLEESYRDSTSFWRGLHAVVSRTGAWPLKSAPFQKYDFFHDLVIRHSRSPAPAFRWYSPLQGWSELTYARLSELAHERSLAWASSGMKPGDKVCILYPLGVEFAVVLLSALKWGAVISCVPFSGRRLVHQRLKVLSPDWIAGDPLMLSALPEWKDRLAPARRRQAEDGHEPHKSFGYASGETVALLLDPCGDSVLEPIPLSSDDAYLGPLREGRLVLGLRPGDKLAFPGADILETQPAVLFSTWMAGATYVHVDWEDLRENPGLLGEEALNVAGLTVPCRDLFMGGLPAERLPWRSWFRNPAESADLQPWQELIDRFQLGSAPAFNLRWRAALGGATLFSLRRTGVAHGNVYPAAGCSWELEGLSSEPADPLAENGVLAFAPLGEGGEKGEALPSSDMIARNRNEWTFLGMSTPQRHGRSYPVEQLLAALEPIPWPCSMVAAPSGGPARDFHFILMVFVGSSNRFDQGRATAEIQSRIEKELGREFLPDRTLYVPLLPRRTEEGAVDHAWCQSQYLSGSLMRKAGSPAQRCLAKLRGLLSR